ncbi:hypothetical protein PHYSODRAFT_336954 [Phytophthora sojae]|uniref:Uncharacterized protein n=1 Tax=Phytophthora sojae (strain P6497) TaxID=1094619 RepID=G4ZXB6_PHYSP|nr:hypothetical protein PHYSODRAFT_336954 [Phytophthora sojae]EGZ12532.1 hypothetical protein PHYSODRAFT_336954 [Phytophthora sojae]|eukprot:XP_009532865.1 hypothetical protein PHYSODRAFT_336954 [Phytophthora sojae]
MSDEDEPMESVVNAVKADASGTAPAAAKQSDDDVDMEGQPSEDSNQEITEATKSFASMLTDLEKKGAGMD